MFLKYICILKAMSTKCFSLYRKTFNNCRKCYCILDKQ